MVSTSIKRKDIVVGTAPTSHIRLKHESIAGRQLLISKTPSGDILIDDLCAGRKADILLNGLRVRKANVVHGDIVSVGPFDIHVGTTRDPTEDSTHATAGTTVGFSDDTAATQHKSDHHSASSRDRNHPSMSNHANGKDELALDRVSQSLKSLLQSPQEPTNQQDRSKKIIPSPMTSASLEVQASEGDKQLERKPMFGERHRKKAPRFEQNDRDSPFLSQHSAIEAQISSIEKRTGDKSVMVSLAELNDSNLQPELGYYTDGQLISVRKLEAGVSIRVPPDQFCLIRQHGNGKISVFFDASVSGTIIRNSTVHPIAQGSLDAKIFDRKKHIYAAEIKPRDIVQILRGRDNYLLRFVKPGSGDKAGNGSSVGRPKRRRRKRNKWPVFVLLAALLGFGIHQFSGIEKSKTQSFVAKLKHSTKSGVAYVLDKVGLGKDRSSSGEKHQGSADNTDSNSDKPGNNPMGNNGTGSMANNRATVATGHSAFDDGSVAVPLIDVLSGSVTKFEVEALIASRQDELNTCFDTKALPTKSKEISTAAMSSRFFVMEDGTIGAATIDASTTNNDLLVDCVLINLRESILDTKPGDISEVTAAIVHPSHVLKEHVNE